MKKQSFKAYRELDRLFKKNEISNEEDTKQDEIKTIYSDQMVHTDENIFEEDYEDEEYLDEEDEMEIESLIQLEKVPSFLDRMKNIKKKVKKIKKQFQFLLEYNKLKIQIKMNNLNLLKK